MMNANHTGSEIYVDSYGNAICDGASRRMS